VSLPALAPTAFEPASLVGMTLDGRYVLTAHLATGGMGAVFRAQHVHLRKDVAVKVLRPDLTSSRDIVERFRREAEIASALEHDNIVRVTDFGRSESDHLFLVMELLTGESLFERLRREGFLSPEEAVPVLWQVCAALEAAHALGVVHRDLKPENVFLARSASGREVTKILDFGIAKIADPPSGTETQAGIVVGTPEYLSPEQAMGAPIDARADVYAVGLIAWRMLAGCHPFKADDARSLLMMQATRPVPPLTGAHPDLAAYPALVATVAKACAKEPDARHQSAALLKDDLVAALGPAFMMPPGATPSPSISIPLPPLPVPSEPASAEALPAQGATVAVLPLGRGEPTRVRVRLALSRAATQAGNLARHAREAIRARPVRATLAALAVATIVAAPFLFSLASGRAAANARALLAAEKFGEARTVVDSALARRPGDPELLLLRGRALHGMLLVRGRALHRVAGRAAEGVEAYAAARALAPLDTAAHEDLVADLGRERSLADKASRVLRDEGDGALPALLPAATTAPAAQRLRALALARDLGAEERIDRVEAYGGLLTDTDCEIRKAAARRLGEIGDAAAVSLLRKIAQTKVETKAGFFGRTKPVPACGAAEADAAARRIEAARLPRKP